MAKIGIIRCQEQSDVCAGYRSFTAIREKSGQLSKYDEIEVVGFDSCGGCSRNKTDRVIDRASRLKEKGAEFIHLGNCLVAACPWKELFINALKEKVGLPVVEKVHPAHQ